jgi:hypothetical protein
MNQRQGNDWNFVVGEIISDEEVEDVFAVETTNGVEDD